MSEQDRLVEPSSVPMLSELPSPSAAELPETAEPKEAPEESPDVLESAELLTTEQAAEIFEKARDEHDDAVESASTGPVVLPLAAPVPIVDEQASSPIESEPAAPAAEEPAPPSFPNVLEAIKGLGEVFNGRLDVLQSMVERELRAEMTRERVVDRLHAELQEYKQDMLLKVLRPVFVDLIQLHDDIGKMQDSYRKVVGEDSAGADKTLDLLENVRSGVEDILYRQGVEPFEHTDTTFDARRQRALSTVPTEDPELNKTVAARIRKGFQLGDKVIRPEIVSVYTLKK